MYDFWNVFQGTMTRTFHDRGRVWIGRDWKSTRAALQRWNCCVDWMESFENRNRILNRDRTVRVPRKLNHAKVHLPTSNVIVQVLHASTGYSPFVAWLWACRGLWNGRLCGWKVWILGLRLYQNVLEMRKPVWALPGAVCKVVWKTNYTSNGASTGKTGTFLVYRGRIELVSETCRIVWKVMQTL